MLVRLITIAFALSLAFPAFAESPEGSGKAMEDMTH